MNISARSIFRVKAASLFLLFLAGCATNPNPWVDDIGFSATGAERRLDHKRHELAATRNWASQEQIRLATLRSRLREAEASQRVASSQLAALKGELSASQAELNRLAEMSADSSNRQQTSQSLVRRRDALLEEIDNLEREIAVVLQFQ